MKKIAPIATLVLLAAAFTSCKKDHTCDCTYELAGQKQTYSYVIPKSKKKDAKTTCESYTSVAWSNIKCSLK